MMQKPAFEQIYNCLIMAQNPLFIIHKKPDGDTLGSALAMAGWLESEGREARVFCRDLPAAYYGFLKGFDRVVTDRAVFTDPKPDVLVVLDSGDLKYAGVEEIINELDEMPPIINIDHHKTNQNYGTINLVDADISSTSELVYQFFTQNNIRIDKHMATALLVGVLTDTGNFTNPATTFGSMHVASELVAHGARTNEISKSLLKNRSIDALRLWGKTLSRLEENKKLNMAYTVIKQDDLKDIEAPSEAVEGVANFLNMLLNVDLVLVLQENQDNTVKGSLRSTNIDVSRIAEKLGGGGHKRAAGFTIQGRLEKIDDAWDIV